MIGKIILRNVVIGALLNGLTLGVSAGTKKAEAPCEPEINASRGALLDNSQISYRAEGGFSGVQSYGVIISCVKGKISVMKSIYDPRLPADGARIRQLSTMNKDKYLALWDKLGKCAMLKTKDAPEPKMELTDEFTVHFYAKVGKDQHKFQAYGLSRPETSRYFAIRQLIDESVNMAGLWNQHNTVAKKFESPAVPRQASASSPY